MTTPLVVAEADIDLLLAEAAMLRSSYLGADATVLEDSGPDDNTTDMYRNADRFDALAEKLAPFCVPPLADFRRECSDCTAGKKYSGTCTSCRGTALWPPVNPDGTTWRLLPEEPSK